ncbi:MAG: nuclear transport factor 2 family protein [Actinomycetota bacterium]
MSELSSKDLLAQREAEIVEIVNRETRAWDTQDAELLLSVFHPDLVWPWPPHDQAHDPMDWIFPQGRYNAVRWRNGWQELFDQHKLVHNRRTLRRIQLSEEGDGAFAVVDADTLWRNRATGEPFHWKGRACKVYAWMGDEWKMTMHTGLLDHSVGAGDASSTTKSSANGDADEP